MEKLDIRKIAMYLAGKLPPYYNKPNQSRFLRLVKDKFPSYLDLVQLEFIQKQSTQTEDLFFMILDDIYKDHTVGEGYETFLLLLNLLEVESDLIGFFQKINKIDLELGDYENEEVFTVNFLLPFFQKLGYENVRYTHGQDEYGKDIVMKQKDKLGNYRYVGVQAKIGNIDGSAGGIVDTLLAQAKDGFQMSFKDLDTKSDEYLSEFIIVTNGVITRNAKDKILSIESHAQRNNISFIDKQKIEQLLHTFI